MELNGEFSSKPRFITRGGSLRPRIVLLFISDSHGISFMKHWNRSLSVLECDWYIFIIFHNNIRSKMNVIVTFHVISIIAITVHVCKLLTCRQYMCICVYTYYAWYLLWFKMVVMYWVQFSSFPRASKTNWSKVCLDRNHRGWRATEVTVEVSFAVRL